MAVALRTLCGLDLGYAMTKKPGGEMDFDQFLEVFETLTNNMFSLPINLPGSGLSRVSFLATLFVTTFQRCFQVIPTLCHTRAHTVYVYQWRTKMYHDCFFY
jgi:hypothetical protein